MRKSIMLVSVAALIALGAGTGTGVYFATRSNDNQQTTSGSNASNSQSKTSGPQVLPTSEPTQTEQQITSKNCIADTCLQVPNLNYPVAIISQNVKDALSKALDNEYKLQSYYQAVINKFGDKRPFSMIIGAEDQHVAVITSLDEKYGVSPIANQWSGNLPSISTFQNACQTSASYEQSTISLLNGLLPQVSSYPDITQVFTNIKEASQNSHLPAFEKCS